MIGVAVVGFGVIGRRHAAAYQHAAQAGLPCRLLTICARELQRLSRQRPRPLRPRVVRRRAESRHLQPLQPWCSLRTRNRQCLQFRRTCTGSQIAPSQLRTATRR